MRKSVILESIQRFSTDLLSNHKEERKSAEIISSTVFVPQLHFVGIFNLNKKANQCKCLQFLEINGSNLLQHSSCNWKPLSIVAKSYLSYMQHDFWICHWQEKHKAQFQRSLSVHENYTFYIFYSLSFFISPLYTVKPIMNFVIVANWEKNSY